MRGWGGDAGGLGPPLWLVVAQLFLLGTFTTTTSSFFLLSFHSMSNNSFLKNPSPLFPARRIISLTSLHESRPSLGSPGWESQAALEEQVVFSFVRWFLSVCHPFFSGFRLPHTYRGRKIPGSELWNSRQAECTGRRRTKLGISNACSCREPAISLQHTMYSPI